MSRVYSSSLAFSAPFFSSFAFSSSHVRHASIDAEQSGKHSSMATEDSTAHPWMEPLELQQRLRSVLVQLLLLASPSTPLSLGDALALLQQPFQTPPSALPPKLSSSVSLSTPSPSHCSFYLLDTLTRQSVVAACDAVLLHSEHTAKENTGMFSGTNTPFSTSFHAPPHSSAVPPGAPPFSSSSASSFLSVQEQDYLRDAHRDISLSRWYGVGKEYARLYDHSVMALLQLEMECQEKKKMLSWLENGRHEPMAALGAPSTEWVVPPVHDVLTWMVMGICHSDPFFRLLSFASPSSFSPPTAVSSSSSAPLASSFRSHSFPSPMIVYPLPTSQWLFTWDFDRFWRSVKSTLNQIRSGDASLPGAPTEPSCVTTASSEAHAERAAGGETVSAPFRGNSRDSRRARSHTVILRPVPLMQSALSQYFHLSPDSSSWTCFHSLYYLTHHASVFTSHTQKKGKKSEPTPIHVFQAPSSCVPAPSVSSLASSTPLLKNDVSIRSLSPSLSHEEEAVVGERTRAEPSMEWEVLFRTWFEQIDPNMPDLLGGSSLASGSSSRVIGSGTEKRRDERVGGREDDGRHATGHLEKDGEDYYSKIPHVGFRELLHGPPRLRQFLSSFSSAPCGTSSTTSGGVLPSSPSSTRTLTLMNSEVYTLQYLMRLLFLNQMHVQTSSGGGFYLALERLSECLVFELGAQLWLAPLSVSRLGAILHWYSSSGVGVTDISHLFREHSFLYLLLWLSGNPSVHRQQRRQAKSVLAFDQMREMGMNDWSDPESREEGNPMQDEIHFLRLLYDRASVFSRPVTIEILAFFVLRVGGGDDDPSHANEKRRLRNPLSAEEKKKMPHGGENGEEASEGENPVLLHRIRGVALQTVYVVNTVYATPMEVWECLEEVVCRSASSSSTSSSSFSEDPRMGIGSSKISANVAVWARIEPLVWCVPYSLLKRRMSRVARGWVRHRDASRSVGRVSTDAGGGFPSSVPPPLSRTRPSLTIKEWAEALLWEREWSGGESANSAVACEMIWSLLALADPFQEHFQLTPPSGVLDTMSPSCDKGVEKSTARDVSVQDSSCVEHWTVTILDENE